MATYFDSSVLLSLVVGDVNASIALARWGSELERVSSILLDLECTTVLRRVLATVGDESRCRLAEQHLGEALEEITLKPVDEDIAREVRSTPALEGCRTLDATHLATALYFRMGDPDLRVCTFDSRMAEVAARLGFSVCGLTG